MPLSHIYIALEKCPPRREKEAPEDESGLEDSPCFIYTHWVYNLPILKEKWNHLSDLGFEENWLSVRQRVWDTIWKFPQGGVPLMIKFIRWYGPVHYWNGYLAMLLVFLLDMFNVNIIYFPHCSKNNKKAKIKYKLAARNKLICNK